MLWLAGWLGFGEHRSNRSVCFLIACPLAKKVMDPSDDGKTASFTDFRGDACPRRMLIAQFASTARADRESPYVRSHDARIRRAIGYGLRAHPTGVGQILKTFGGRTDS